MFAPNSDEEMPHHRRTAAGYLHNATSSGRHAFCLFLFTGTPAAPSPGYHFLRNILHLSVQSSDSLHVLCRFMPSPSNERDATRIRRGHKVIFSVLFFSIASGLQYVAAPLLRAEKISSHRIDKSISFSPCAHARYPRAPLSARPLLFVPSN